MDLILANIKIKVNEKIYLKDPETSKLGQRIINESIFLIDSLGFDHFTFKKLGEKIGSNESSIYRYFENKHMLLVYLGSWYWSWIEYRLVISTTSISDPMEQLLKAIKIVTEKIEVKSDANYIDESVLHRIIVIEFTKTFLTKEVDIENKEGFFLIYKRVINRIIDLITAIDPTYPFAKSFVSSIVEGSLHQHFLSNHLKTITNCSDQVSPSDFYTDLVQRLFKK